jgi:hypothetical protein
MARQLVSRAEPGRSCSDDDERWLTHLFHALRGNASVIIG